MLSFSNISNDSDMMLSLCALMKGRTVLTRIGLTLVDRDAMTIRIERFSKFVKTVFPKGGKTSSMTSNGIFKSSTRRVALKASHPGVRKDEGDSSCLIKTWSSPLMWSESS